jgi:hypothetical protein
MSEPETAKPTYSGLVFVLEHLVADALRLDDEGLELLEFKLLQAHEKVATERRKRKAEQA